ncbi:MAG: hypothetical protein ACOZEN_09330 [Thermodesulfobacteriota bacterium]
MRRMTLLAPMLLAALLSLGCSTFSGRSQESGRSLQAEVLEYLDAGRPKAALAAADQLVLEAPDDYNSYLTRNAVHLVLRDFESARADNEKALSVFEANRDSYPEKERNYRQAKIHESMALTELVASRRARDSSERQALEARFREQAAKVKALDEETWKNLQGLTGQAVGE